MERQTEGVESVFGLEVQLLRYVLLFGFQYDGGGVYRSHYPH